MCRVDLSGEGNCALMATFKESAQNNGLLKKIRLSMLLAEIILKW